MQGSLRCGLHVDRKAHVVLDGSKVIGNGRGVAVCDGSVNVQRCLFEDNVGWAVRLEGPAGQYVGQENGTPKDNTQPSASAGSLHGSTCSSRPSVIIHNTFGSVSKGNVGRKRVRVDL